MKRSPMLATLLATAGIALALAGPAHARESASPVSHDCGSESDRPAEIAGDTTCDIVEQAPPADPGITPDRRTDGDPHGATGVGPSGADGQSTPYPDEGAVDEGPMRIGHRGTDGPANETADEAAKRLGQMSTDDQVVQVADDGAAD
jgi:hypothetical protein